MGQGNPKLKGKTGNPMKKAKPVRGDQQKLRKGKVVIPPKRSIHKVEYNAQAALTKKIGRRIEQGWSLLFLAQKGRPPKR